jgi:primosomal protein N' (replication factor Y) (superfamily II helicase)
VQAALLADPGRFTAAETERRRTLGLPPFAALATVSGPGSGEVAEVLRGVPGLTVGGDPSRYVVRAPSWDDLGRALNAAPRPKGSRLRVEVDPPRL